MYLPVVILSRRLYIMRDVGRLTDGCVLSGRSLGRSNEIIAMSTPRGRFRRVATGRRPRDGAAAVFTRTVAESLISASPLVEQMGDGHLIRPIGSRRVVLSPPQRG